MRVKISRVERDGKITLQETGGFAIVTLHRPASKNAMTQKMWRELALIGQEIPKNKKNKVVIVRGGERAFTAGSDIKEFSQMTVEEADESFRLMEEAIATFEKLPLPTIAAIHGPAMGAGFVLALSCDLRVGCEQAKMGIPIGRLGITLSKKFVKRIVELVGPSRMKDLVYTSRILTGKECYDWGLLNYMAKTQDEVDHYVMKIAEAIKGQSQASLKAVKEAVAFSTPSVDLPIPSAFIHSVDPKDFHEGVLSFIEKRKPKF